MLYSYRCYKVPTSYCRARLTLVARLRFAAYRTRTVLATCSLGGTPQLTRPPENAEPYRASPGVSCVFLIKTHPIPPHPSAQAARMNHNYFEVSYIWCVYRI